MVTILGVHGVYLYRHHGGAHAIDLEGRDHLRARQRAGEGVQRDRRPTTSRCTRCTTRTAAASATSASARSAARSSSTSTSPRRTTTATRPSCSPMTTSRRCRPRRAARSTSSSSCRADQVDPIMFEKAYYLEPDSKSFKAYALLRKTLEETDRTAIVQFALRQKTRLGALRVRGDVLVLQALLWDDEVREAAFPSLDEKVHDLGQGAADVRGAGEELRVRLRAGEVPRRLPGAAQGAHRGEAGQGRRGRAPPRPSARPRRRAAARCSTSWRRCAARSRRTRSRPRRRPRPRSRRRRRRKERLRRSKRHGRQLA